MLFLIAWIKEWAQGIVVAVVIATILEMLLPDNKNKKYVNTVIGIYILFSIIAPVISRVTGKNIDIQNYIDNNINVATNYTISNVELLENTSKVEDIYIKTLKEDITNNVRKVGFEVNSIELKIDTISENNYGEILGIYLKVSSIEEKANIDTIDEIKINLSENTNKELSSISEGQLNQIREMLMEQYGIEKNKIHIN